MLDAQVPRLRRLSPSASKVPHIVSEPGAVCHLAPTTSHLLGAQVQFLTELLLVEVASPQVHRVPDPDLYDIPLLHFGSGG
ncbi:hypothetical protein [Nocardiopsis sp. CNT312]|uniref:hypothetical protein n=1 Tax=Nocardiopsis sp. CNT312 TaxID=1137268 RepID=UPI001E2C8420|nr:hypothetical protein [Nocardiopsis sp. CNT312]